MAVTIDGTSGITFPDTSTQDSSANELGNGQTWQQPSRSGSSTVYQNTTGRTIVIAIDTHGSGDALDVSSDNVNWTRIYYWAGGTGSYERNLSTVPIPDGYYYKMTGPSFYYWSELR